MPDARHALLPSRGVLSLTGPDAVHFLNNLVTSDVEHLEPGQAAFAALLSPQGKILFDFLVFRTADGFLIDVARTAAADLAKRLTFYRLRAKVVLADLSESHAVAVCWGGTGPAALPDGAVAANDPRLAELGLRLIAPMDGIVEALSACGSAPSDEAAWTALRIALGVPQSGEDFDLGDVFPHDVDMDQLAGVSFRKGCYVGQEIVARMEHRGTARKRMIQVTGSSSLPAAGTPVMAGEQQLGTLGSSTGNQGLALLRLDKVKAALDNDADLTCGSARLTVSLPAFARFGWPQGAAAEG